MYTEDDDEVKMNKQNSNSGYDDFYSGFKSTIEKDNKKSKKKKKKKEIFKKEEDYADFYGNDEDYVEAPLNDNSHGKMIIKVGIAILFLIVLAILLVIIFKKKDEEKDPYDIELSTSSYSLKVGEKDYISYKIVGTDENVLSTFTSSNPEIVTVDENGELIAISKGEATITINYTIHGKNKEKKCTVKVESTGDEPIVTPTVKPTTAPTTAPTEKPTAVPTTKPTSTPLAPITLNLSASTTNWSNKDVTITVAAKSGTKITELKYTVDCSSNCSYQNVTGGKIVISKNGTTKVKVIAKDQNKQEISKEITVKIDKEAPSANLSGGPNFVASNEVNVCVSCSDSLSGCKQNRVCKKYSTSQTNQTITVYDNAGNSKTSTPFNVTINKVTPACSLSVSSDGIVSATLSQQAVYYGFNQDCTGNNELSKKIDINASNDGDIMAKLVNYYVKTQNGNIGSCNIVVIKECKCTSNAGIANCPVKCTFRAN